MGPTSCTWSPPSLPISAPRSGATDPGAKDAFLLAIVSAKRVSELHALSVSEQCIHWNSDATGVALWPNPSFFPKRLPSAHYNQVIELAAYGPSHPPDEEASSGELLCPARALRCYILLLVFASLMACLSARGARGRGKRCPDKAFPSGWWR